MRRLTYVVDQAEQTARIFDAQGDRVGPRPVDKEYMFYSQRQKKLRKGDSRNFDRYKYTQLPWNEDSCRSWDFNKPVRYHERQVCQPRLSSFNVSNFTY